MNQTCSIVKQMPCRWILFFLFISSSVYSQDVLSWVSTSAGKPWNIEPVGSIQKTTGNGLDIVVNPGKADQVIEGFGACFNELGWLSLGYLNAKDREEIMNELFNKDIGARFTVCRMPIGANDFSRSWYSYNDTVGDFEMKNFSINNDFETLVPFIKNALKYNPELKLWASPWSPPTWMKYNKHYAAKPVPDISGWSIESVREMRDRWGIDFKGINNGMRPEQQMYEGTDMFIQEEKYYEAYSLYFSKFIDSYSNEGIKISMVMPQNEFNSDQVFPSCTWRASSLAKFVSYLGPVMKKKGVDLFFGTVERSNTKLIDTLLTDPLIKDYLKGVGFQWAGKDAVAAIHKNYPKLVLYQTEQECGNGYNDWKYCTYAWSLMKQYLNNGVKAYLYWNISLKEGGRSSWGWHQNSLVVVNTQTKTYRYTYEYYLMKHFSHYIRPGAKRVEAGGEFNDLLAFVNPDKSVVILIMNADQHETTVNISIQGKIIRPTLKSNTINSILLKL